MDDDLVCIKILNFSLCGEWGRWTGGYADNPTGAGGRMDTLQWRHKFGTWQSRLLTHGRASADSSFHTKRSFQQDYRHWTAPSSPLHRRPGSKNTPSHFFLDLSTGLQKTHYVLWPDQTPEKAGSLLRMSVFLKVYESSESKVLLSVRCFNNLYLKWKQECD